LNRDRFLTGLLLIVGVGGLLPLGAMVWWIFELFSHFRIQYLIVAVPLLVLAMTSRRTSLAVLIAAAVAVNARPLLAYLPTATDPETDFRFDVLNVNVNAGNSGYSAIADAIRSADAGLVAVVELTPALDRALQILSETYPHRYAAPANGNFGIGILSRYPLIDVTEFSIGPTRAIDAMVELPAGPLRFIAVHLLPPMGKEMALTRNLQLDELAEYAATADEPLLLCGDFNLTSYSPYFDRFSETAELADVRLGQGTGFSWPSFLPLAGVPIDHCLIRGPLAVVSVERLDPFGSDHYPVRVSLGWQGKE
jgi:endonuclease/exonuclease/phosphatase (EEP) superfamily protein YafD